MTERPTAAELIEAVREFLERDVARTVDGRVAFHTRVAVNALAIVARELEHGSEFAAREQHRLGELLDADGSLDELRAAMAAAVRRGDFDDRLGAIAGVLEESAAEGLAVSNPRYSGVSNEGSVPRETLQ